MKNSHQIPQIDMAGVAIRLEALRSTTGLSQDAFAKSFGLDPSSYTKLINNSRPGREGNTKPLKSEHAYAAAIRWDVTMDFIYRGTLARIDEDLRAKLMSALNRADA